MSTARQVVTDAVGAYEAARVLSALAAAEFVVIRTTDPEVIERAAKAIHYSHGGQRALRSRQIVRDVLAALGEPEGKESDCG